MISWKRWLRNNISDVFAARVGMIFSIEYIECVNLSLISLLVFTADLLRVVFWKMVEDTSPFYPPDICTYFICCFSRENKTSLYTKTSFWQLSFKSKWCHSSRANSGHIPPCDVRGIQSQNSFLVWKPTNLSALEYVFFFTLHLSKHRSLLHHCPMHEL